ncbi:methyl-accepting chemotaxis protein [Photobacterium galatheae]|uniref:Chemotaxis protein n=1 Tax=Photobacterium galatheae TaxID=1654360 RepID=A0A066RXV5_9GAMM|nr:methyl-accepting chemotaxis protein [Photobacterium galatheae]KDM92193.1 chemotaxis protein [Photobacterium galatheae]MCM0151318.1 methyl-accepting chemotaxis protein [Photobacterium galatheae]
MTANWNLKTKLSMLFTAIALIIIAALSAISYHTLVNSAMNSIDTELNTAAHAVEQLIGDLPNDEKGRNDALYDDISSHLTHFTQGAKLEWAYSTVRRNGLVYYTYINRSTDEWKRGQYKNWYLERYDEVPDMLNEAFRTEKKQYQSYQGEFGRYRSVFVPFRDNKGEVHVIGIDVKLTDIDEVKADTLKKTFVVAAVFLVLAVIVGRMIANLIVTPINGLNEVLRSLANGNWDLNQRVKVRSQDEIGEMSDSFNIFMAALRNRMLEVQQSSDSVAATSAQLDMLIRAVADRSMNQSEHVGSSATAIEELAASAQSITEIVDNANQQMGQFEMLTQTTVEAIEHAVRGMQSVQQETNTVAGKLQQLDSRAGEINSIVEVIKDIADQTNLLALNAAIEAARAGTQGRGFAVVADEVRQLSERTAKATVEISTMISSIQTDTSDTTQTMQTAVERVDNSVQHADQANASLSSFNQEISAVSSGMEEIAGSVKEQAHASDHLSRNVASLSDSAEENRLSTMEAQQGVDELKRRADVLRQVVNQFTL